jgi:hypothetical protein
MSDQVHWPDDKEYINLELCHRCNKAPSVVKRVEQGGAFGEQGGIRCWLICRSCEDAGRVQKVESNRWSDFFGAFKHAAWHWNRMIEKQKGDVFDRFDRGYKLEYVARRPEENDAQFKARIEERANMSRPRNTAKRAVDSYLDLAMVGPIPDEFRDEVERKFQAMRHKLNGGVICSECGKHLSRDPRDANFHAGSNLTRSDAEIQYSCSPECLERWTRRTRDGHFPYCVGYDQDGCPCQHAADCEPFKEGEKKCAEAKEADLGGLNPACENWGKSGCPCAGKNPNWEGLGK